MKGRLAVMTKFSADFDIREYIVPEVEPDAALVRITRGGICGSDLHIWRGELQDLIGPPDRGPTLGYGEGGGERGPGAERAARPARRAAQGGRPGPLLLLPPVGALPCLPRRAPGRVPEQAARDAVRRRPAALRRLVR